MGQRLEASLSGDVFYHTKNYEYLVAGHRVDFYHRDSKTVVEFYGDFHHRSPAIYGPDTIFYGKKTSDVWAYDNAREMRIRGSDKTVNFIIVWEAAYRQNPTEIVNNIIQQIGNNNAN